MNFQAAPLPCAITLQSEGSRPSGGSRFHLVILLAPDFFHYIFLLDTLRVEPDLPSDYWKHEPVVVNDGGAYFFQVQFDVETGTFLSLRFNGYA